MWLELVWSLEEKLIDQNHYTAMILVTVITTLVAPLILKLFILKSNKKVAAKDAVSIDS